MLHHLATHLASNDYYEWSAHRGRDASYPTTPAQIPACSFLLPAAGRRTGLFKNTRSRITADALAVFAILCSKVAFTKSS
jgi:hypothetical protein